MMKKKEYVKPESMVIPVECVFICSVSTSVLRKKVIVLKRISFSVTRMIILNTKTLYLGIFNG